MEAAPLPEEDALASLENRIKRAVDLVAELRAERDAAVLVRAILHLRHLAKVAAG